MEVQMKLGEILVETGLLTHEKLQQALIAKNTNNLKLGQYLAREGIVDEAEIVDLLSRQLKIKKYRPGGYDIDKLLTEILPAEMAHRFQVAPLKMNDHLIEIAMIFDSWDKSFGISLNSFRERSNSSISLIFESMGGIRTSLSPAKVA